MLKETIKQIFSTNGRVNRLEFLIILIICILGPIIFSFLGNPLFEIFYITKSEMATYLYLICLIPFLILLFMSSIGRLHDMNKPGWLVIGHLIPLINLAILVLLLFGKGDEGKNNYGDDL